MGAGQSTDDAGSPGAVAPSKQSYYTLLGVDHDSTGEDIKKAYRRKALELHPDRNYGDVERATTLFAEVQTAYEVLSDPQERAWYDSHEETILRGGDASTDAENYEHNVGLTSAEDITRIISRFNGGVEFSDAPSGFFGFLLETFEQLAKEELRAAQQQDTDPVNYPSFGHKDDKHEDVVRAFYAHWASFSTRKTFAWKDKYSMRGAEDRRTRRLVEKENRHFRDEGVREFNDAVRALVAFVRKRDPRFMPNTQSEEERQRALRDATRAQAERMRARNLARMEEEVLPEWAKMREPGEVEEESEEESEEEQFECVACRKVFKSENQFEAHERSKKHAKVVQALRRKLQKEGVELDLGGEGDEEEAGDAGAGDHGDADNGNADAGDADTGDADVDSGDGNRQQEIPRDDTDEEEPHPDDHTEHEEPPPPTTNGDSPTTNPDTQPDDLSHRTHTLNISQATPPTSTQPPDSLPSEASTQSTPPSSASSTPPPSPRTHSPSPHGTDPPPKQGKAAQKRARKAAQTAEAHARGGSAHACAQCGAVFQSKTRLFQHIKDWGHAAPVAQMGGAAVGTGKRKGKRA